MSNQKKRKSPHNRLVTIVLEMVVVIAMAVIASLVFYSCTHAYTLPPETCGKPVVPPSTAEYCTKLPPPGLHVSVPWQVDDFDPGREIEVVKKLHLRSYYNYQPTPRPENPTHPEHLWLDPKHVPMYYDLTYYEGYMLPPNTCEFQLLWNEPDVVGQANQTPETVALWTNPFVNQQSALCYQYEQTNWGGIGVLGVDLDGSYHPPRSEYIYDYLQAGGPVPDAWTVHAYADSWDNFMNMWNNTERILNEYPEIGMKDGKMVKVIITEVALISDDTDAQMLFMAQLKQFISVTPRLHSAYWFTGDGWNRYEDNFTLVGQDEELTSLGHFYNAIHGNAENYVYLPVMSQ